MQRENGASKGPAAVRGRAVAGGSLVGRVHILDAHSWLASARVVDAGADAEFELLRLREALARANAELVRIRQRVIDRGRRGDAEVFAAHQQLIDDPMLLASIERHIREQGLSAEAAVVCAVESVRDLFLAHPSPLVRDKADDVLDVGHRLVRCLSPSLEADDAGGDPLILVAPSLEPSELVRYAHRSPCGAIVEFCGSRSHVAILARSFGVPLVAGVATSTLRAFDGELVRVDGDTGVVELAPTPAWQVATRPPSPPTGRPLRTRDGVPISLSLNLSDPLEADAVAALGADGVGLFRSEFLYMDRDAWPTEEELLERFEELGRRVGERSLAIRLADFGADKCPEYADFRVARNPGLGLRGVRLLLERRELLVPQLRALRRLARGRSVTLLIPMLDGIETLDRLEAEIIQSCGAPHHALGLRLGAMIEIPAAALVVRELAPRVSSLAIGLNDLTQYVMAADREDEGMERYHDPFNPALLRLVRDVIEQANRAERPVSVCGELAGDPALTSVLVSLGIRHFSVSRVDYQRVAATLGALSVAELESERSAMLSKGSSREIREFLAGADAHRRRRARSRR